MFLTRAPARPIRWPGPRRAGRKVGGTVRPRRPQEVSVSDFTTEIHRRAGEAQQMLAEARESADDYLVRLMLGDLESLSRLAADYSIRLDGVHDTLACHCIFDHAAAARSSPCPD